MTATSSSPPEQRGALHGGSRLGLLSAVSERGGAAEVPGAAPQDTGVVVGDALRRAALRVVGGDEECAGDRESRCREDRRDDQPVAAVEAALESFGFGGHG